MKFVKQNAFWIGVGAAGAILAIFFLVVVLPTYGEISDFKDPKAGKISQLNKALNVEVPSNKDIKNWENHNAKMKQYTAQIIQFHKDCDANLERWFDRLDRPGRDAFMARYRDEIKVLEQKLLDRGVSLGVAPKTSSSPEVPSFFEPLPEGLDPTKPTEPKPPSVKEEEKAQKGKFGFNWEMPTPREHFDKLTSIQDVTAVLKELQKRYWARLRLANVILEGGVKVNRILHVAFPKVLHDKIPGGPWGDEPGGNDAIPTLEGGRSAGLMGYLEYDLPGNLAKTLTFVAAVELPYSEVPKFIRELLNPASDADPKKRLLVTMSACRVTIRDQNLPQQTITFNEKIPKEFETKAQAVRDGTKPLEATLVMRCHVIDFDPEAADNPKKKKKNKR